MPHGSPRFVHGKILHNSGSGIFYRMEVAVPERVDFVPGQFAMVSGWPGNDPLLPRPLAIFRSGGVRGKGTVEFVYQPGKGRPPRGTQAGVSENGQEEARGVQCGCQVGRRGRFV